MKPRCISLDINLISSLDACGRGPIDYVLISFCKGVFVFDFGGVKMILEV